MTETLQKIEENRDHNRKLLKQKKSLIIKQISAAKSKVLKYLDDIEERLITEIASVQEKNEEKINREKLEICQLTSILKDNKQDCNPCIYIPSYEMTHDYKVVICCQK
jgi:gas vesicle protein